MNLPLTPLARQPRTLAGLIALTVLAASFGCAVSTPPPRPTAAAARPGRPAPPAPAPQVAPGRLGILFRPVGTGAEVLAVKADSPAARAGIMPGEVILKADNTALANLSNPEIMQLLAGAVSSRVTLTLLRPSSEDPATRTWSCTLERVELTWTAADMIDSGNLLSLLVSGETDVALARHRNRALVEAKTLTLPRVLRQSKTVELTALAVRVEQTILDLNHEAELAKDRAQRLAESNPSAMELHRELALAYKERIELLKPFGAAIKEELANRGK